MYSVFDPERVQRPKVTFPQIKFIDGSPVFNVLIVGTTGSGKTVLLSALEEQLSVFGKNGFRLRSNTQEQRDFLRTRAPDAQLNPYPAAVK
jgi:type IV secretory pathway VirB4 component